MEKNETSIIKQAEMFGKQLTVYGTPEEPLFLAKEVAEWLEHPNPSELVKLVDEEERLTSTLLRSGQGRQMWFLTEDGLYEILMLSRKPIAKQFKKGVKKILKEIRKTGGYIAANAEMSDEEIMSRALDIAHRTIERKNAELKELESKNAEQRQIIADKDNAIAERDRKIEEDAPKVATADALCVSKDACDIGVFAKILTQNGYDIGKNRLFDYLRKHKYLFKRGGFNFPYQKYVERKIFEVCESTVPVPGKSQHITSFKTLVTGKGQVYFINLFLKGVQTIQFDDNDTREYVSKNKITNG